MFLERSASLCSDGECRFGPRRGPPANESGLRCARSLPVSGVCDRDKMKSGPLFAGNLQIPINSPAYSDPISPAIPISNRSPFSNRPGKQSFRQDFLALVTVVGQPFLVCFLWSGACFRRRGRCGGRFERDDRGWHRRKSDRQGFRASGLLESRR
jgi:hypothetical protein